MAFNESLQSAIEAVQSTISAITGVAAAPAAPTDAPSGQWPISIAFPRLGEFSGGGNAQTVGYHTIVVQLHYARADLARAYATIVPYLESIIEALHADVTLGATVTTISDTIGYEFGAMEWAGLNTIGWQFEIPVKIRYTAST